MKLFSFLNRHFSETRKLMIDVICELIEVENTNEIELNKEMLIHYVDDQFSEVLSRINTTRKVGIVTYMNDDVREIPLNDLSFDQ